MEATGEGSDRESLTNVEARHARMLDPEGQGL